MPSIFKGKLALITGASSGFGEQYAYQMANKGANLILVARRTEKLNQVKENILRSNANIQVYVFTCDLTSEQSREELFKKITEEEKLQVDILVNNAGLGLRKPFTELGWTGGAKTLIDLNVSAVVHLTHLFLQPMLGRNFGYLIFVSSVAGLAPTPNYQVYGAAKSFVRMFSLSLRTELEGTGVTTSVVCPPHSTTGFQEVAHQPKDLFFNVSHVPADEVVSASINAAENGEAKVIPGWKNKILFNILGLLPEVVQSSITAFFNQYKHESE